MHCASQTWSCWLLTTSRGVGCGCSRHRRPTAGGVCAQPLPIDSPPTLLAPNPPSDPPSTLLVPIPRITHPYPPTHTHCNSLCSPWIAIHVLYVMQLTVQSCPVMSCGGRMQWQAVVAGSGGRMQWQAVVATKAQAHRHTPLDHVCLPAHLPTTFPHTLAPLCLATIFPSTTRAPFTGLTAVLNLPTSASDLSPCPCFTRRV